MCRRPNGPKKNPYVGGMSQKDTRGWEDTGHFTNAPILGVIPQAF